MSYQLRQKAQARLARETGAPPVKWGAPVRVALAFPNLYSVGMASLGYQLVYRMLNDHPSASCERVFLPDPEDLKEHQRSRTELFSLETQTPLAEFDVVAFSISFELDYVNVLRILDLANLPLTRVERDDRHPIVIAGGPCATFNPEPLADFVDAFVIGDAEAVLSRVVDVWASNLRQGREATLADLSRVPGVYVPAFYEPEYNSDGVLVSVRAVPPAPPVVQRAVARDLSASPASSIITTPEAEFGETELVEVARGCGRKCRFCLAGHITRPPRPREVSGQVGGRRLGLVGAAVFDHPNVEDICRRIVESGGKFTVSSVRLETVTRELAELMAKGGQKTLTIAPEAATNRLRAVINKCATEDEITSAVAAARDAGLQRVKLYFMIGLPTETDEDVEAIAGLSARLAREFPGLSFQVSVSSFVPKPWTPFQWHPMETEQVLKRRYAILKKRVSGVRGVKLSGESPRLAIVQEVLARGDRRVGQVISAAAANGGDYAAALRNVHSVHCAHGQRQRDEVLPWDHIDAGIGRDYLWREYLKGLEGVASAPCRVGECRLCGVCE